MSSWGHLLYTDSMETGVEERSWSWGINLFLFLCLLLYKETLVLFHVKLYTCAHLMSSSKEIFFVKVIDLSHNRNAESVGKIKGQHKKNLWGNLIAKIRLNIVQNFSFQCFNSITASVTKCVCVCTCVRWQLMQADLSKLIVF